MTVFVPPEVTAVDRTFKSQVGLSLSLSLSLSLVQSCDLCYVDAQTSGFVGLGINAFPGLCVHYFLCTVFCMLI